jgi:hypothetical protein
MNFQNGKETPQPELETPETNRVLGLVTRVTFLPSGEHLGEQFTAQYLSKERADFVKLDEFGLPVSST